MLLGAALVALLGWAVLGFAWGRFWLCDQRLEGTAPEPAVWPPVTAVVPARDEADVVERTVGSLLRQEYPGRLEVVLVDDESSDGTAAVAQRTAEGLGAASRLRVVRTGPRPPGWVGKMWAVATGVAAAGEAAPDGGPPWLLLTDADVEHGPRNVRRLVAFAEAGRFDLVSLMVRLHCRSPWERLLIPMFVYGFMTLYPFPRVNDPRSATAAAAGGCMLVRRSALEAAGGIAAIRDRIIDDCALGRLLKARGRIWLGLTAVERSIRPYDGLGAIWRMVARSAYTQLGHSPALLAATLLGLALLYVVPPLAVLTYGLHGDPAAAAVGLAAWLLMAATWVPTLALYDQPPVQALALPVAGALYAAMTFDSARRHWAGRGATWKGRPGAGAAAEAP